MLYLPERRGLMLIPDFGILKTNFALPAYRIGSRARYPGGRIATLALTY
ncbi:hypothetical protein CLV84_0826 [Neolewinella xylanilytica]|uniref:Uncharacterized protein n=1 Tax=Neolewinella xylanilytica TaxID=1514080 RepID=A0A2S6I8R5_9BACT|nr:hypothetical protein CLV84_0826 [Neolewinella xylanilytica]